MKNTVLKISAVITVITVSSFSYADNYRGVYKCYSSGVVWESATPCPAAARAVQGGINFSNHRMTEQETYRKSNLRNVPNAFEIKERYNKYRSDIRWNNARSSDQQYLNYRLAELDRSEQIELNNL